eukprot:3249483-Heterocapsa_arctica.AAC.1
MGDPNYRHRHSDRQKHKSEGQANKRLFGFSEHPKNADDCNKHHCSLDSKRQRISKEQHCLCTKMVWRTVDYAKYLSQSNIWAQRCPGKQPEQYKQQNRPSTIDGGL